MIWLLSNENMGIEWENDSSIYRSFKQMTFYYLRFFGNKEAPIRDHVWNMMAVVNAILFLLPLQQPIKSPLWSGLAQAHTLTKLLLIKGIKPRTDYHPVLVNYKLETEGRNNASSFTVVRSLPERKKWHEYVEWIWDVTRLQQIICHKNSQPSYSSHDSWRGTIILHIIYENSGKALHGLPVKTLSQPAW